MKHFLLVAIALLACTSARAQNFSPLLAKELQDTLDKYVSSITNIKGMSASVYLPGRGVWTGTHGVSHAGNPIHADMIFGIASNTKVFVAATILKLVENGVLSLDDRLDRWIAVYPNINPSITLRQLLNHTSGISDPLFVAPYVDTIRNNPTRVFTPDEVMRWVGPPAHVAGTGYSYSNINYVIAGLIAERATSKHISALIREFFLVPLELNNTFFDVKELSPGPIAHRWYSGVDFHDTPRVGLNTAGASAGAIFSTSSDMVRWYHALLSGKVLDSASFAELTTFVATTGTNTYGLGIEHQVFFGNSVWGHSGSTWGYRSRMAYDPKIGAAVSGLANSWPAGVDGVTLLLYNVLIDRLPAASAAITGVDTVCQGQSGVTLTTPPITSATSYEWILPEGAQGASTTTSITVQFSDSSFSGVVTVRGVNPYGEGVLSTKSIIVLNKPPTPSIILDDTVLLSNTPSGNQWYNSSGKTVGATSQIYAPTVEEVYYVIVTNSRCTSDTSNNIRYVLPIPSSVRGEQALGPSVVLHVYPNPVSDELVISFGDTNNTSSGSSGSSSISGATISIVNTLGRVVYSRVCTSQVRVRTSDYAPGVYIVLFERGNKRACRTIVKE